MLDFLMKIYRASSFSLDHNPWDLSTTNEICNMNRMRF